VTVMVPHYALSGGTLIALGAHEIVLAPSAVRGPADPQIGQQPAASVLAAVQRKTDVNKIDDETLVLADMSQKAISQPRQRVDALIAAGIGTRFDPGHGRLMKDRLALNPSADQEWLLLVREALEFGRRKAKAVARGQ